MLRLVTVIGVLGGMGAAMAAPVRMTSEDIKRAMPGALLEIDTPLRMTIPVKVGTDGLMSAEAGALGLTLGATKDRGRWWTENDKLCMKWFRWFDAKPRCMVLHRDGNRVQWAEASGESGTATITEAQKPEPKPVVAVAKPKAVPAPVRAPEPEPEVALVDERVDAVPAHGARTEGDLAPDAPTVIINRPGEAEVAQTDYEPAKPEAPSRFSTAALGKLLAAATAQKKPEPSRLGMSVQADSAPAEGEGVAWDDATVIAPYVMKASPAQRAKEAAPTRKPANAKHASAKLQPRTASGSHATAHATTRKVAARQVPEAVAQQPARPSFRVYGVEYGDHLNVRSGPSEYHAPVGAISRDGRGVEIVGACRDLWCPIRYGQLSGWVNRYYLAEEGSTQRASASVRR